MTLSGDIDNLISYLEDEPTNEQLKAIAELLPRLKVEGGGYESFAFLLNYLGSVNNDGGGGGGDASSANQLLQLTELEEINTKTPTLVGGKVPVDVSLSTISSSTVTSISAIATDTTLLASNVNRKGASFYLDSTDSCYLLLGIGTSSPVNYSIKLLPNSFYELAPNYTGIIKGVFTGTNGSLKITEFS
jgi:hypothetical protein